MKRTVSAEFTIAVNWFVEMDFPDDVGGSRQRNMLQSSLIL